MQLHLPPHSFKAYVWNYKYLIKLTFSYCSFRTHTVFCCFYFGCCYFCLQQERTEAMYEKRYDNNGYQLNEFKLHYYHMIENTHERYAHFVGATLNIKIRAQYIHTHTWWSPRWWWKKKKKEKILLHIHLKFEYKQEKEKGKISKKYMVI